MAMNIDQIYEDIKSLITKKDEDDFLSLMLVIKNILTLHTDELVASHQSSEDTINKTLLVTMKIKFKEFLDEFKRHKDVITPKEEEPEPLLLSPEKIESCNSSPKENQGEEELLETPKMAPPPPPPPPPLPPSSTFPQDANFDDFNKRPSVKMKLFRWSKLNMNSLKMIQNPPSSKSDNVWTIKKFPDLKKVDSDFNRLENLFSQCEINKNYSFYTRTILHRLQKNFNESKRMDLYKVNSIDDEITARTTTTDSNSQICTTFKGNNTSNNPAHSLNVDDGEENELELLVMSGVNSFKDRKTHPRKLIKDKLYSEMQSRSILSNQRCLNINIFLSQFKQFDMSLLHLLQSNKSNVIGAERLKGLVKLLPTEDEEKILSSYQGHICLLDPAEQFFVQLVKINRFRERIDNMLLIEEFQTSVQHLRPVLKKIQDTTEALVNSEELCKILQLILYIGNFINCGEGLGSASGFKISSLLKLSDVKSNNLEFTLLHFLAQEIEDHYKELFAVEEQFVHMKEISEVVFDQLKKDFIVLHGRVMTMKDSVEFLPEKLHNSVKEFLVTAFHWIEELQAQFDSIKFSYNKLADYFCEDYDQFKAEECFRTLYLFLEQLKRSRQENFDRKQREIRCSSINRKNFRSTNRGCNQDPMAISNIVIPTNKNIPTGTIATTTNATNRIRSSSLNNTRKQETLICQPAHLFIKGNLPTASSNTVMSQQKARQDSQNLNRLTQMAPNKTVRVYNTTKRSNINTNNTGDSTEGFCQRDNENSSRVRMPRTQSMRIKQRDISLKSSRERILVLPEQENISIEQKTEISGSYNDSGIEDVSEKSKRSKILDHENEEIMKKVNEENKNYSIMTTTNSTTGSQSPPNSTFNCTSEEEDDEDKETLALKHRLNMTLRNVNETEIKLTDLNGSQKENPGKNLERLIRHDDPTTGTPIDFLINDDDFDLNRQLSSLTCNTLSNRRRKLNPLNKAASFLSPSSCVKAKLPIEKLASMESRETVLLSGNVKDENDHGSNVVLRTYSKCEPQRNLAYHRMGKVCL